MTLEKSIKFWLNSCLDDFNTANMIQTKDHPPYLHDLVILSKKIDIVIPKHIHNILRDINPHYIIARYKPQRFDPKIYNQTTARKTIKLTQGAIKWFTKKMDLKKYLPDL